MLANSSEADETTSWTKNQVPLLFLIKTWILNISRIFVDFNYNFVYRSWLMYLVILILLTFVGYSIYFLCRQTQRRVWLFVLTLIGVTALTLALPDLISGGRRSSVARYLIPSYLGIQLSAAYLLTSKIMSISISIWRRKLWQIATVTVISSGVLSCAVSFHAEVWWNKYNAFYLPSVAKIINHTAHPLVITSWLGFMPLSHVLKPNVRLQTLAHQNIQGDKSIKSELTSIDEHFSDLFVYDDKKSLQAVIDKYPNYQIEKVYEWKSQIEPVYETKTMLWKLAKP